VIPAGPGFGTWRTAAVAPENQFLKVSHDLPVPYAAAISVNPTTAYRLLHDFAQLKPGDVVIQNAANSMVGQCVIQLAKTMGITTVNIVRSPRLEFDETVSHLQGIGGDIVVGSDYAATHQFKKLLSDLPPPKLALNGVGGESATELARNLGQGGLMVTYGGMSKRPVSIPTSLFIFRDITLRGFWLTRWVSEHSMEERKAVLDELTSLVKQGKLKLFLETHKFSQFENALTTSHLPQRNRKVVLEMFH